MPQLTRLQMPRMPELAERVLTLQKQVSDSKAESEQLSRDLETPQNAGRWRPLVGEDPSEEQLTAKVGVGARASERACARVCERASVRACERTCERASLRACERGGGFWRLG